MTNRTPAPMPPQHEPQPPDPNCVQPARSAFARMVWAGLGVFFVVLGSLGIVLPGLPTTPFLILAASCFVRSSQRLYDRLLANRWFGPSIEGFRRGEGVPIKAKVLALSTMAVFVSFALWRGIPEHLWPAKVVVSVTAVIGAIYLLRLPTRSA